MRRGTSCSPTLQEEIAGKGTLLSKGFVRAGRNVTPLHMRGICTRTFLGSIIHRKGESKGGIAGRWGLEQYSSKCSL